MESRRRRAVARLSPRASCHSANWARLLLGAGRGRAQIAFGRIAVPVLLAVGVAACGDDGDASSSLSAVSTSGRQIAARAGCAACHGADGDGGIGPAWSESLGTEIELEDGTTVTVDESYLTRSIAEPGAEVHAGFAVQMPENQLTDAEIADVVAYIVELNASGGGG